MRCIQSPWELPVFGVLEGESGLLGSDLLLCFLGAVELFGAPEKQDRGALEVGLPPWGGGFRIPVAAAGTDEPR